MQLVLRSHCVLIAVPVPQPHSPPARTAPTAEDIKASLNRAGLSSFPVSRVRQSLRPFSWSHSMLSLALSAHSAIEPPCVSMRAADVRDPARMLTHGGSMIGASKLSASRGEPIWSCIDIEPPFADEACEGYAVAAGGFYSQAGRGAYRGYYRDSGHGGFLQ